MISANVEIRLDDHQQQFLAPRMLHLPMKVLLAVSRHCTTCRTLSIPAASACTVAGQSQQVHLAR